MIEITYNGLALHSEPYSVTRYDGYGMPTREVKTVELARQDGAIQVAQRLGSRTITVEGQIKAEGKPELINAIDQLKAYLYSHNGTLVVVDEDGIERTWECTPTNVAIVREGGSADMAGYSIAFYCPKPYSTSEAVELLNENITTQPVYLALNVGGTYPANPVIVLTINSMTAGEQTITVGNQTQDRSIEITTAFTAGDTITIDTDKKEVYINTVKSDYSGAFPSWGVGGGSLSYVDTASARDVDIVLTYNVRRI